MTYTSSGMTYASKQIRCRDHGAAPCGFVCFHLASGASGEWMSAPLAGVDLGGRRQVADADLAQLRFRGVLRILNLSGTGVSDAGLAHLRNLLKLSYLDLSGTAVTDAGLAHLATLRNLAELSLANTAGRGPGPPPGPRAVARA
jgi:hypothetical protein